MSINLTEEEFLYLFREDEVLRSEEGVPLCPHCSNSLSAENLDYWNLSTEAGTPHCSVTIGCDICRKIIWAGSSWWPGIDNTEEFIRVFDREFEARKLYGK